MRSLKIIISMLVCLAMILSFAACGKQAETATPAEPKETETTTEETTEGKTLVVVFSATGNTRAVAQKIAELTEADYYEIEPEEPYEESELKVYNITGRIGQEQSNKDARPAIAGEPISLDDYTRIFIGYPIWYVREPRIMDTFAESYDFTGKTVIPFCTSGSLDIGTTGEDLAKYAGTGNWLHGKRFEAGSSEEVIKAWLDELK
jgi:flavodoxin